MLIIDESGQYKYQTGTKTLETSEHPAYQARIEMALGAGKWACAPSAGHNLARFDRSKLTEAKREELEKEVRHYLRKYGPAVVDRVLTRYGHVLGLEIVGTSNG